jgi:hypothetical protein
MLDNMLKTEFTPQYGLVLGSLAEYKFTQPMIQHLSTLGYDLYRDEESDDGGNYRYWYIRIQDRIVKEMRSDPSKPRRS